MSWVLGQWVLGQEWEVEWERLLDGPSVPQMFRGQQWFTGDKWKRHCPQLAAALPLARRRGSDRGVR